MMKVSCGAASRIVVRRAGHPASSHGRQTEVVRSGHLAIGLEERRALSRPSGPGQGGPGRSTTVLLLLVALIVASCSQKMPPEPVSRTPIPSEFRLVLVLVIDQFRGDYLQRFDPVFRRGLRRLETESVSFLDAHQDHAVTNTGPGHASIATGTHPSRSGIITNEWYDRVQESSVYCVGDNNHPLAGTATGAGRSPANLLVSSLPDWMQEKWPESKVMTASYKDRSAILLGGKQADASYWYSGGNFVTSTYYRSSPPEWVASFNSRRLLDRFFGTLWEPHSVAEGLKEILSIETTDLGWFHDSFPRSLGGRSLYPNAGFYSALGYTPWMDWYLTEFVKEMIVREEIGTGPQPDFLGISFSATDLVGHRFGPNSPELLDTLTRLDEYLGDLLDFVDERIGLERTLIVLSSDHGVCPLPEYRAARGLPGRRADATDTACWQGIASRLAERLGAPGEWMTNSFYLDRELAAREGLSPEKVEKAAAQLIEECPVIEKVWTRSQLLEPSQDHFHRLFANSFHPERSPDLLPQVKEYQIILDGMGTTHGSPYDYDTHVPILFRVPGLPAGERRGRVRTIDIAPTLAEILGLEIPAQVEGKSLINDLGLQEAPDSSRQD